MRKAIGITVALSVCLCGFSAPKASKQSVTSTGILIVSNFAFAIQGDGISTTFNITPHYTSQSPAIPRLPLVGMVSGSGSCTNGFTFIGSVAGKQLVVDVSPPPPADAVQSCYALLLFQPQ